MNEAVKLLPILVIEKNKLVPENYWNVHRKYIIAAVEILSGEYPYLSEYMDAVKQECSDESCNS
jgi:RNA polymerase sigma factor